MSCSEKRSWETRPALIWNGLANRNTTAQMSNFTFPHRSVWLITHVRSLITSKPPLPALAHSTLTLMQRLPDSFIHNDFSVKKPEIKRLDNPKMKTVIYSPHVVSNLYCLLSSTQKEMLRAMFTLLPSVLWKQVGVFVYILEMWIVIILMINQN